MADKEKGEQLDLLEVNTPEMKAARKSIIAYEEWKKGVGEQHANGTHQENIADAVKKGRHAKGRDLPFAILDGDKVREIRKRLRTGEPQSSIARRFGVDQSSISHVSTGKNWKSIPVVGEP